ncbi:uncharacterized protein LOC144323174 [Canis aureus]
MAMQQPPGTQPGDPKTHGLDHPRRACHKRICTGMCTCAEPVPGEPAGALQLTPNLTHGCLLPQAGQTEQERGALNKSEETKQAEAPANRRQIRASAVSKTSARGGAAGAGGGCGGASGGRSEGRGNNGARVTRAGRAHLLPAARRPLPARGSGPRHLPRHPAPPPPRDPDPGEAELPPPGHRGQGRGGRAGLQGHTDVAAPDLRQRHRSLPLDPSPPVTLLPATLGPPWAPGARPLGPRGESPRPKTPARRAPDGAGRGGFSAAQEGHFPPLLEQGTPGQTSGLLRGPPQTPRNSGFSDVAGSSGLKFRDPRNLLISLSAEEWEGPSRRASRRRNPAEVERERTLRAGVGAWTTRFWGFLGSRTTLSPHRPADPGGLRRPRGQHLLLFSPQ